MDETVQQAYLGEAKNLIEVALTALAKIKVMNLEPEERASVRTSHDVLERISDGLAPRVPKRPLS